MGVVVLDADDIADTVTRKMGNEVFDTSEKKQTRYSIYTLASSNG